MRAVVTVDEMREIDARVVSEVGLEQLIERAGYAAAIVARRMMHGCYGRTIAVVAGKGHNGDDGRSAARHLTARGAKVVVYGVGDAPSHLDGFDLVIDAAYGTGFRGSYRAPTVAVGTPVLALDVPSGLDAMTGEAEDGAVRADVTVTFGAYKPGLLFNDGPAHVGELLFDPIGFAIDPSECGVVEDQDLIGALVRRPDDLHKWMRAVFVCAGAPGMTGAARLCALGALRAGATMVRLGSPSVSAQDFGVTEAVALSIGAGDAVAAITGELSRCRALVIGPGLSRDPKVGEVVRELAATVSEVPMVIDADGLYALGEVSEHPSPLFSHNRHVIVTPHGGEFARLFGRAIGADRIGDARALAQRLGAIVLLKGPTTIVAAPSGKAMLVNAGTSALATAGTGDVLSGVIGAFVARGLSVMHAGAFGAHIHGMASQRGPTEGLIASELPELIASVVADVSGDDQVLRMR